MPGWISRTVLYAALCLGLHSATVARAQEAAADPLRARAQRSLTGPSVMLGSGLALILAAPIVSVSIFATSIDWSDDETSSGENDDVVVAYGLGIGMTLVGSALTAWGATQVAQIRSARRRLAYVEGAGFELARGGAQLSLRFRY